MDVDYINYLIAARCDVSCVKVANCYSTPEFSISHDTCVLAYRNLFRTTSPTHPWNELNDEEFLQRIKAQNRDRVRNVSGITKAGRLMFGNVQSITDHFPY